MWVHFCMWLLGAYLAGCALYYGYWVVLRRRWVEVIPGWCFQSGAMLAARLIRFCATYGVATVFDFRGARDSGVAEEAEALRQAGVRHVNIPCGRAPSDDAIRVFLQYADAERLAGRKVLLHCKDGQGRAVFFAAVCLIEYVGLCPPEAYYGVRRIPPSLRWIRWFVPRAGLLGRRNPKYRMILDYQSRTSLVEVDGARRELQSAIAA